MSIKKSITLKSALLGGLLFATGASALAVPVTGTLGFTGTGSLFTYTSGGVSYIDFQNPLAGGHGLIRAANQIGYFADPANMLPGDVGTILDMSTQPSGPYTHVPVATPVSIDNFLTFTTLPTVNFQLTLLPLANCSNGGTCIGPFQLLENDDNVSVSMNIRGLIYNGTDVTRFTGLITAQFLETDVDAVRLAASSPGGALASSFGGSITASLISNVPEPESITLISIGVLAMLLGGLRAKHKTEQDS